MTDKKKSNPIILGPSPQIQAVRLLLLVPPHLQELAHAYCLWSHSKHTPTQVHLLNTNLPKELSYPNIIKIVLFSSFTKPVIQQDLLDLQEQTTVLQPLCAKLALMHQQAKASWRLWPTDSEFTLTELPELLNDLKPLYHPPRMKALSLLLGGVTLSVALKEYEQQAPTQSSQEALRPFSAPDFGDLDKNSRSLATLNSSLQPRIFPFPWIELQKRIKEIEKFGRLAYLPILLGVFLSSSSLILLTIYEDIQFKPFILVAIFVLGQLSLGIGIISFLWSYFEHRALRQRVFLFWIDMTLNDLE